MSEYLLKNPVRKLQIGAGPNHLDGWLNTDRDPAPGNAYLDATRRFPLSSDSMDYVFAEHTIEHFTYEVGQRMLRECLRVLVPGGRLRLCTPDMAWLFRLLNASDSEGAERRYVNWSIETFLTPETPRLPAFAINQVFRGWGHRFIYDAASLQRALESAGFVGVSQHVMGESADNELRGIDSHGTTPEEQRLIGFETLAMEAFRPRS